MSVLSLCRLIDYHSGQNRPDYLGEIKFCVERFSLIFANPEEKKLFSRIFRWLAGYPRYFRLCLKCFFVVVVTIFLIHCIIIGTANK